MKRSNRGGGWGAIWYALRLARKAGFWKLWKALGRKNACKTCALGMGGQLGGMRNELGRWPEVCKKSLQAMVADMQQGLQPAFFERYSINQLRTFSSRELENCGRLTQPLYAGPDDRHYRILDWDEALRRLVEQLRLTRPDQLFIYSSGRSSNEAGFLLQLFARLYGTNYINNCSYYCHQASGVALNAALGTATATVTLEDVEKADLFVLIGGNPASNHPRLMRTLMNIRRRKGHVIVINPVKEVGLVRFAVPSNLRSLLFGSNIASLYIQPHIGGDIALLTGVAKIILDQEAGASSFIAEATEGFAQFAQFVRDTPWTMLEDQAGVSRETINQVAQMYLAANNVVFGWTMGITQHVHGVDNVHALINLALLRGMVGRPGAGLLPIRGHSNVQGIGSMGVTPNLRKKIFENLEAYLHVQLPTTPGLDTMACMQAADQGQMRLALCLGGNLYGSNPDAAFAARALGKLDFLAYFNTTLNTGHAWGRARETLILPVLPRDEEQQPTTQESMFNYVRLSDGGPRRWPGLRSEVDVIATIARQVLGDSGPVDWRALEAHKNIREMIGRIIPGFEQMLLVDQTRQEFHITGRIFHQPCFPTPSGKARFKATPLPDLPRASHQLRLMTVRSEGQFNTVVYEEADPYRGQERRDIILLNKQDRERFGLSIDQPVTVRSEAGAMAGILVREGDLRAGNALMYYPEANVLVPIAVDPLSKTPAFKSVLITIEPESPLSPSPELPAGTAQDLERATVPTAGDGPHSPGSASPS